MPVRVELPTDEDQIALIEARNGLRQVDAIRELVRQRIGKPIRLRVSDVLRLNRVAIEGLNRLAGVFRTDNMTITNSRHNPPPPDPVPEQMEEMCDYVNESSDRSAIHLASYLLWRINWIHPFDHGNGRTARAASYAMLCIHLGYELPGTKTIPEQIAEDKVPYYKALEAADASYKINKLELAELEALLEGCLASQLIAVHYRATGKAPVR